MLVGDKAQGEKWLSVACRPISGSLISSSHLSDSGCHGHPRLTMAVILAEPDFTLFPAEEQVLVSPELFCHGGGSAEPEL